MYGRDPTVVQSAWALRAAEYVGGLLQKGILLRSLTLPVSHVVSYLQQTCPSGPDASTSTGLLEGAELQHAAVYLKHMLAPHLADWLQQQKQEVRMEHEYNKKQFHLGVLKLCLTVLQLGTSLMTMMSKSTHVLCLSIL